MAKGTLGQVIQRAISDAAFRNRLRTDPGGALSGFDLTPAERTALQSGDAAKLASFGVDQRMSKAYAMGEAASGVSRLVGTDVGMATTITDGGTPLGTNAILEDAGGAVRNADIDASGGAVLNPVRDDGGPFDSGSVDAGSGTSFNAIRDDGGPFDSGSVDAGSGTSFNAIRDDGGPFDSGSVGTGADTTLNPIRDDGGPFDSGSVAAASDSNATSAFVTADEQGNNVVGTGGSAAGATSLDVSGETRDGSAASVAASDSDATSAYITADEAGNDVSASSIAASDSNATDAFLTADEMGNNVVAGGRAPDPDTALTQNDALTEGTATADPEGYDQPDPNAG